MITSRTNERIKRAAKLRVRRAREKQGRLLIDGTREMSQAMAAGIELDEVFVCQALCQNERCLEILKKLPATGASRFDVTPEVFAKLAFGDRIEGIVCVAKAPQRTISELALPESALVAVLEGIEKPGNLGAVVRTADAAGVSAVIVVNGGTDLYNPSAIRASLGTIFHVPVCGASVASALDWLHAHRLSILTATPNGKVIYTDKDYRGATAVVLGSEAHGLSAAWASEPCLTIRLPMLGTADSLNVASTAAVIFYEALRQRSGDNGPQTTGI